MFIREGLLDTLLALVEESNQSKNSTVVDLGIGKPCHQGVYWPRGQDDDVRE